jgi:spoIIIJ-associated protein
MPEISEKDIESLKEIIDEVISTMGVNGTVFTKIIEPSEKNNIFNQRSYRSGEDSKDEDSEMIVFNIKTNDANLLIGHNGECLCALQHLIRILTRKRDDELIPFCIDINNYKTEKGEKLQYLARLAAEKARDTGKKIALRPMPAYERRIVHVCLAEESDLYTESEGEDPDRRIIVKANSI